MLPLQIGNIYLVELARYGLQLHYVCMSKSNRLPMKNLASKLSMMLSICQFHNRWRVSHQHLRVQGLCIKLKLGGSILYPKAISTIFNMHYSPSIIRQSLNGLSSCPSYNFDMASAKSLELSNNMHIKRNTMIVEFKMLGNKVCTLL